ncbi:dihydroxyacetone kinase-like protein [Geomicrobium halophilum]|uniref:phosphoenolpyruvate--glycerone phosphotransferase n=1 Tax=Geomicrobium halophilum TaxID=549000 RepID=A0A841PR61_9BACL|nr:dihydroxyacetone kinase subunit DhaL [Geomicrobium halophilum]MBB6451387.1 dihydroxyacetone kinase-like protein [Geomicrobium halophilum]
MNAKEWKSFLIGLSDIMKENRDYLCELDRYLGDGDHGVTMAEGWTAVKEHLEEMEETDCGKLSMKAGKIFLDTVGSSVGPLYASGFLSGARCIKEKEKLQNEDLVEFWEAFIEGVQDRGQAEIGDKTTLDTWLPILGELKKSKAPETKLLNANELAEQGMQATKDMVAVKGRASRLGDRSLGYQDPGATSAHLIYSSFIVHYKNSKIVQQ